MPTTDEIRKKVDDVTRRVDAVRRKKVELATLLEGKKAELSRLVDEIRAAGFDPTDLGYEATNAERDLAAMVAALETDLAVTDQALASPAEALARDPGPGDDALPMASLKTILADLQARHTREILDALAGASIQDLQDVAASLRAGRQGTRVKTSGKESRSAKPTTASGHALEKLAASVVGHLKEHGPLRAEDIREALGISREDTVKALTLAMEWKVLTKTGEKRATTYNAVKQRGPKPQITLGERMRVAAITGGSRRG